MSNNDILKRQILYRSKHRGIKEMDLLLGDFVNKYINSFNEIELKELKFLLNMEDNTIYKWYFNQSDKNLVPTNEVTKKLKRFKL